MAFYEMGQALVTLADASIYGVLGHATFDALLHEELEMSVSQAERLMATVRRLGEDQAADLGYEKSLAVASALSLPGSKLTGAKRLIGKHTLDTTPLSRRRSTRRSPRIDARSNAQVDRCAERRRPGREPSGDRMRRRAAARGREGRDGEGHRDQARSARRRRDPIAEQQSSDAGEGALDESHPQGVNGVTPKG